MTTPDPPQGGDEPTGPSPIEDFFQEPLPAAPPPPGPPVPVRAPRRPAYYVGLTVAVMLVIGLIAGLAVLATAPPVTRVAGTPSAPDVVEPPTGTESAPAEATTTAPPATGEDPYAELATHPLSTGTATMPDQTCALPRFDPADAAQASFYQAVAVCADTAFGALLSANDLSPVPVEAVTVYTGPVETPCGTVEPTSPATQCAGTVYMTPAHLRDTEGNDRYPGRYVGVFLREYAKALLETGGLGPLYEKVDGDIAGRIADQATCLAGIASGAMDGRGAVDDNITGEIRARLSEVDATEDAATWLAKGSDTRQLAACNTWV
ncbi:hypothetical protein BLA60_00850 [Actinophytocola xinjiangensis]|uniref:Metalloprotease n=1 Tax=Actinophytocola xinjiangensis TaxID=485602 RepID=A0A7Z1AZQ8_9PSEU|nr:hypothetical protein [Actinophytocola xinjiangensis]OLF13779.1 hypothetical protein BLA60_00850 [Actinophytocola xinjiangensis]